MRSHGLSLKRIEEILQAEGRLPERGGRYLETTVKRMVYRVRIYRGGYEYAGVATDHGQHPHSLTTSSEPPCRGCAC